MAAFVRLSNVMCIIIYIKTSKYILGFLRFQDTTIESIDWFRLDTQVRFLFNAGVILYLCDMDTKISFI